MKVFVTFVCFLFFNLDGREEGEGFPMMLIPWVRLVCCPLPGTKFRVGAEALAGVTRTLTVLRCNPPDAEKLGVQ